MAMNYSHSETKAWTQAMSDRSELVRKIKFKYSKLNLDLPKNLHSVRTGELRVMADMDKDLFKRYRHHCNTERVQAEKLQLISAAQRNGWAIHERDLCHTRISQLRHWSRVQCPKSRTDEGL